MGIPVPISQHNTPLPPDALTDVRFNFEWRRLIVERLWAMTFDDFWQGADVDVQAAKNAAIAMIEDIYTSEPPGATMDYLGALVHRTTLFTAPVAGTLVPFEGDSGDPSHDVGGFWDIADPWYLTVPTDGAGYYRCYAYGFAQPASTGIMLRLHRGITGILAWDYTTLTGGVNLAPAVTALFTDGERLTVEARTTIVPRNFAPTGFSPYSVTLGMYRVGLAP